MKIVATTTEKQTIKTYKLSLGDRLITYIEFINDKGKVIDCNLRDVDGEAIYEPMLLEQVEEFINSLNEDERQAAEDADEQLRRDEKNGLYPDKVDIAN